MSGIFLPLILNFLGESHKVFNLDDCAVFEGCFAGEFTEYLMLVALDELDIGAGSSVDDWHEVHFEFAVIAGEGPRFEVILGLTAFGSSLHRNVECNLAELV